MPPTFRRQHAVIEPVGSSRASSAATKPSSTRQDAKRVALPSSRAASSFGPRMRTMGEGISGFKTSFDSSAKGGGAFKPISENFSVSPANGTMSLALPVSTSPGRNGFGPELQLAYDSGAGNGPFGFGWNISLPSVHLKTTKSIPRYLGDDDLVFSGADIVKQLKDDGTVETRTELGPLQSFDVVYFRPRVDNRSMRIEKWTSKEDATNVHWRTISSDNKTTIYGDSDASRILDTSHHGKRVFSWMPSKSYDAFGNAVEFSYKSEDYSGVADADGNTPSWEKSRSQETSCRQKYVKRIKYGNRIPSRDLDTWTAGQWPTDWMFEVVFDYGEHDQDSPRTTESGNWPVRKDVFSQTHAGFEIRTYRLCRRVLMFHHFLEHVGKEENLVSSTMLRYDESLQRTTLSSVTMNGHNLMKDIPKDTIQYRSASQPSWSFQYNATPDPSQIKTMQAQTLNLLEIPTSSSKVSQWLDLDGEGMPGLLTTFADGTLCYQRNTGLGTLSERPQFLEPMLLQNNPNITGGTFTDLDQNGHLDYVVRDRQGSLHGYFERGDSDTWSTFSDFPQTPTGDISTNAVEIDLTGDGLADVLSAGDDSQLLVWQRNLGKQGLSGYQQAFASELSSLPPLTQTSDVQTHVADMSGSGLSDLVQISASTIIYWPNLGHGNFGAPVEMGNPPFFAPRDEFDHDRVRLIDVDGSGTTDLLYMLPEGGAALYYNFSGNSWSEPIHIPQLPKIVNSSQIFTLDILGKGTACLCWADASTGSNLIHYFDLMGDVKPHLLNSYSNGLGLTTSLEYSPSTRFYAEDAQNGHQWSTKLPFPVQCISKVDVADHITGNRNSTRYVYHNGCYNTVEKQFVGFEMVETFHQEKLIIGDNEIYETPTTHTKSWFSVGLSLTIDESRFLTRPLISSHTETSNGDDTECLFALKGVPMRSERYSQDGTDKANLPFQIQELSYEVKLVQSRGLNKYAVVQVNSCETLSKQYERNMEDSRTTHLINLRTNPFGDVEESLRIVYPRKKKTEFTDVDENQEAGNMSLTQIGYTEEVEEHRNFRKPQVWRQQEHEILNFHFSGTLSVDAARKYDFINLSVTKSKSTWKALRSEDRAFYQDSLLQNTLDGGKLQAYSVLDRTYSLAFTPEILAKVQRGLQECSVPDSLEDRLKEGKYVKLKDSDGWWVPSSRAIFCHPKSVDTDKALEEARKSFYTPSFFVDVFENVSRVKMDNDFLLVEETEDAVGNVTSFKNDYEFLQPVGITDSNMNTVQIALSPLGQTIAIASLGKGIANEKNVDSLGDVVLDISTEMVDDILVDPNGDVARRVLGSAGSRTIYCTDRYIVSRPNLKSIDARQMSTRDQSPAFVINLTRATSGNASGNSDIRVGVSYLNGHGGQLQEMNLNDSTSLERRWLVTGLSISDKQGNVICSYHPCFSTSPKPIPAHLMATSASFAFHDALHRPVASLTADCMWSKTVHTPWTMVEFTTADMVLQSKPQDDGDVGHFFTRISPSRYAQSWYDRRKMGTPQEKRAAEKSAVYADAPSITHFGSCGLPIRTVRIAGGLTYTERSLYDVNGNKVRSMDSYNRLVEMMFHDKLGRQLQTTGMDQGQTWALQDALGGELLSWNCRGYVFMTRYDSARREIQRLSRKGSEPEKVVTRITYGEGVHDSMTHNLNGQIWKIEDQSGVYISSGFDIRGQCVEKTIQYTQEYKATIDWNVYNALGSEVYSHTYCYDNLGQLLEEKDAQGNFTRRRFTRQGHVHSVDFSSNEDNSWKPFLSTALFSAEGLPEKMTYGNKVTTDFIYEVESKRLLSEQTKRQYRGKGQMIQDLSYMYDCAGRRILTQDLSEQAKYFRGSYVKPEWGYNYDAAGRLASASGRGQLSKTLVDGCRLSPHNAMTGHSSSRGVTDGSLLYQYLETYRYDKEGNIKQMRHEAPGIEGVNSWTRHYFYNEQSLLSDDPKVKSNRLSGTAIGDKPEGIYRYDGDSGLAGCMTTLPRFSELDWNMNNMLSFSSTQFLNAGTPERTYYVYDHSGNRVRKVTESAAKAGEISRKTKETLFLSHVELQTSSNGSEIWIASITGDGTLATVEVSNSRKKTLVRFQTGNNMELDDQSQLISYEEYSPFGAVVYSAMYGDVEAPRAYRFSRYKHDRETGLYHCGRRYYCPWLGRWTSPDPLGDVDGPNLYEYVSGDPINLNDPSGTSGQNHDENSLLARIAWLENRVKGLQGQCVAITGLLKKKTEANPKFNETGLEKVDKDKKEESKEGIMNKKIRKVDKRTLGKRELVRNEFGKVMGVFRTMSSAYHNATKSNNEKWAEKLSKDGGDQHHLYQKAYGRYFKAANIDYHSLTVWVNKDIHNTILTATHDPGWEGFFVKAYKDAGGTTPDVSADGTKLAEKLRLKGSDESIFLMGVISATEGSKKDFRKKMRGQVIDNMKESGMSFEKSEGSIGYYVSNKSHIQVIKKADYPNMF
ncbi:virulence plasmid 65kDa B protein-domain-containing protein [Fusarium avenaceum]|nr:virulence plasmid 65kDa B protein-domain-containing protein [Fusarium avenaceum]